MSFIPNFNDAQSWLNSWQVLADNGSERAKRFIREAAIEQRANLESVKYRGYHPEIQIPEYERGVRLIERAAKTL